MQWYSRLVFKNSFLDSFAVGLIDIGITVASPRIHKPKIVNESLSMMSKQMRDIPSKRSQNAQTSQGSTLTF